MRRRRWLLVVCVTGCLGALPGCALFSRQEALGDPLLGELQVSSKTAKAPRHHQHSANDEPEPIGQAASPYHMHLRPPPKVVPIQEPVPGQKVAETQGPPQALQALEPGIHPDWPTPVVPVNPPSILPSDKLQEPLVLALDCLLKKQYPEAITHLERYEGKNQELFMQLLPALVVLTEKKFDQLSNDEVAGLQEQVQALLKDLRTRSDLVIAKMCLCKRIDGYGQYEPVRDGHAFQANNGQQAGDNVQVYVELRNIASELREQYYTTLLNGTVRIRDAAGKVVWFYNYRKREMPLRSSMPLLDCYRAYDFFVPAMPAGKYMLTIEVRDETSQPHRMSQKSVDFIVAAPVAP